MADRYLLHKPTQALYIWQAVFAADLDFEEVAEDVPEVVVKRTRKARAETSNAEAVAPTEPEAVTPTEPEAVEPAEPVEAANA